MKVSRVMPKMAGMESTANTTSLDSTITSTTSNGVASQRLPWRMKNRCW